MPLENLEWCKTVTKELTTEVTGTVNNFTKWFIQNGLSPKADKISILRQPQQFSEMCTNSRFLILR